MELTKSVPVSEADKPVREFAEMVFKTVARDQTVGVDLTNLLQALFPDCRASWVMRDDRIHLSLDDVDLYEIITAIMGGIEDDERYALVWTMLADAAGQLKFMNGEE